MELAYKKWASLKGPYYVKKLRYIGLRGWRGYIQKIQYKDELYAGEIYECETLEGKRINAVFRIPYRDVKNEKIHQVAKFLDQPPEVNYLCDGFTAFVENDFSKRNNFQLIERTEEISRRIIYLKDWYKFEENPSIRLCLFLYIRRLETPCRLTVREWKECNPNIKDFIICHLKEIGFMI